MWDFWWLGFLWSFWDHLSVSITYTVNKSQELIRMLSIQVRNWYVPSWAYESGTDACTERNVLNFKRPLQNMLCIPVRNWGGCVHWAYESETDAYAEHKHQKLKFPTKIKITSLYFSPKINYPKRLYAVIIMKIWVIEILTLGHL